MKMVCYDGNGDGYDGNGDGCDRLRQVATHTHTPVEILLELESDSA